MSGPLTGVKVVDFSAVVSGPLAAMWLAEQGADVIKVETLGAGDVTRASLGAPDLHGLSGLFVNCNRGKRCVSVDVATAEGRQIVLDLCKDADVFVQNWRPGVVDRLGLGYEDVAAVRPDIIYVSISGFGPDGPYAQRRVYDPIIQGLTGYVAVQVNPEIPFPDLVRSLVCDKATALTAAQAVTAALFARERGAGGQHLVVPMLDASLAFFFPDGYMAAALMDDERMDERTLMSRTYRVSTTADGQLIYHVTTEAELFGLFRALGHPEWIDDERFATPLARRRHREDMGAAIAGAFETMSTAELTQRLEAEEVPFAPVLGLDDVPLDRQIVHNEALRVREHPMLGRVLEAAQPVRFSATPTSVNAMAGLHGEHTDEVLRELGRDDESIAALRSAGVVS